MRRSQSLHQELTAAGLSLSLVLPFTLFVLLEGSVAPLQYLKLLSAMTAASLALICGAVLMFAMMEVVGAGRASGFRASPSAAIKTAFRARWAEDRLFSLAWPIALFTLLLPSFNAFKQRILPQAGFVHDPELAAMDRALFGADPGILLHELIGSPATTLFFDGIYHGWFVPTTIGVAVVGLCAGTKARAQYMLAYVAVWVLLGAMFAYLVPAAGPAFYEVLAEPGGAGPFRAVHEQLAGARDVRFLSSLGNQAYLLENLNSEVLVIGGGISALPSIHNAVAVLFAIAGFRAHRLIGLSLTGFALLIWIGSVYLNWHYAIDGIVGAVGAIAIWYGSGWVVDRALSRADTRRPRPAAAAPAAI